MKRRDELQRRARQRLVGLKRRERDPRFQRVMGRFVHDGLLILNRDVEKHREPVALADVLWAGELEPRLLELLPALVVKRPGMFEGIDDLPEDLGRVVADLRRDRVPSDFRGLPGADVHRWLRRVGRKGQLPAVLRSFRLTSEDLRLLEHLSKQLGLSQTDVIRRGLRALV